jgi:hypothetical protein
VAGAMWHQLNGRVVVVLVVVSGAGMPQPLVRAFNAFKHARDIAGPTNHAGLASAISIHSCACTFPAHTLLGISLHSGFRSATCKIKLRIMQGLHKASKVKQTSPSAMIGLQGHVVSHNTTCVKVMSPGII